MPTFSQSDSHAMLGFLLIILSLSSAFSTVFVPGQWIEGFGVTLDDGSLLRTDQGDYSTYL